MNRNLNQVKSFFEKLKNDAEFKAQLLSLRSKYKEENLGEEETVKFLNNDLIPFAKSNGFSFSIEDLREYEKSTDGQKILLSDADLENVAGGFSKKDLALGLCSLSAAGGLGMSGYVIVDNINKAHQNNVQKAEQSADLDAKINTIESLKERIAKLQKAKADKKAKNASVKDTKASDVMKKIEDNLKNIKKDDSQNATTQKETTQKNINDLAKKSNSVISESSAQKNTQVQNKKVNEKQNNSPIIQRINGKSEAQNTENKVVNTTPEATAERVAMPKTQSTKTPAPEASNVEIEKPAAPEPVASTSSAAPEINAMPEVETSTSAKMDTPEAEAPNPVVPTVPAAAEPAAATAKKEAAPAKDTFEEEETGVYTQNSTGIKYKLVDGNAVICGYNREKLNQILVIPKKITINGKDYSVTRIDDGAFSESDIKKVTIPSTVTEIGGCAFELCHDLTDLTFEAGSQLETIEYDAFVGAQITSIEIPASVKNICHGAFADCEKLTSVIFTAGSQLETIDHDAFAGAQITSIEIPASVKNICRGAFADCEKLTSVIFTAGSQLETIEENAFVDDAQITSIEIPASVKNIHDKAFAYCEKLTSVIFKAGSQLNEIHRNAFEGCTAVKEIHIADDFDIGKLNGNCLLRKDVKIYRGSNLETTVVEDGKIPPTRSETSAVVPMGGDRTAATPSAPASTTVEKNSQEKLNSFKGEINEFFDSRKEDPIFSRVGYITMRHNRYDYKIDQGKLSEKIRNVGEILKKEGTCVEVGTGTETGKVDSMVIGDLHGNIESFKQVLDEFLDNYNRDNNYKIIFLGDYTDRGAHSVEVLYFVLSLKEALPENVTLLRGNHETTYAAERYGFWKELDNKFGKDDNMKNQIAREFFSTLPMAAVLNGDYFCVHGGLSPELVNAKDVNEFFENHKKENFESGTDAETQNAGLGDLYWSDPSDDNGFSENGRGAGCLFGPDTVNEFLGKNRLKAILRAHQIVNNGLGVEEKFGGKVKTIFSSTDYTRGANDNIGGFLKIYRDKDRKEEIKQIAHDKLFGGPDVKKTSVPTRAPEPDATGGIDAKRGVDKKIPNNFERYVLKNNTRHVLKNNTRHVLKKNTTKLYMQKDGSGAMYEILNSGKSAFAILEKLNVTEFEVPDQIEIEGEIYNVIAIKCPTENNKIETLKVPASVIGNIEISDCKKLKKLEIDENNPVYCSINNLLCKKVKLENKEYTILADIPLGLEDITIPKKVEFYDMFFCDFDREVKFDDESDFYYDNVNKILFNKDRTKILAIYFWYKNENAPNEFRIPDGVKEIGDHAFNPCCNVKKVVIPKTVEKIGNAAFCNCEQLEEIVFEGNVPNELGYAIFEGCVKLKKIDKMTNDQLEKAGKFMGELKLVDNRVYDVGDKVIKETNDTVDNATKNPNEENIKKLFKLYKNLNQDNQKPLRMFIYRRLSVLSNRGNPYAFSAIQCIKSGDGDYSRKEYGADVIERKNINSDVRQEIEESMKKLHEEYTGETKNKVRWKLNENFGWYGNQIIRKDKYLAQDGANVEWNFRRQLNNLTKGGGLIGDCWKWKIHVLAQPSGAKKILEIVSNYMTKVGTEWKSSPSISQLILLDTVEISQMGKFITIYPADMSESQKIVKDLDEIFYRAIKNGELKEWDFAEPIGDISIGKSGVLSVRQESNDSGHDNRNLPVQTRFGIDEDTADYFVSPFAGMEMRFLGEKLNSDSKNVSEWLDGTQYIKGVTFGQIMADNEKITKK